MIYLLTDNAKRLKWKEWCRMNGGGISGYSSVEIADKMTSKGDKFTLENLTLGEIASMSYLAEKELARYAFENFKGRHYAIKSP